MLYNLFIKLKPYQLINIIILFLVKRGKREEGELIFQNREIRILIKINLKKHIRELRK